MKRERKLQISFPVCFIFKNLIYFIKKIIDSIGVMCVNLVVKRNHLSKINEANTLQTRKNALKWGILAFVDWKYSVTRKQY